MRGASLQQPLPWVFSQTQGPCFPCSPSPPSLPLTPSHPLSLPIPPWVAGTFLRPQEALEAFTSLQQPLAALGLQSYSGAVLSLLPLTPSHPLSLPRPPCVPGTFLGPQEALGAFTSLRQPWVFSQTQGPCFPCSPSLPLTPSHYISPPEPPYASRGPWDLPGALGSLGRLCKPLAALGFQSDSGALLSLLPLTPPRSLSLFLTPSCPLNLHRPL